MSKINETIGYARGLLKSMEGSTTDSVLFEVLTALTEGLDAQAQQIAKLEEQFNSLDEYVESLDDDLADMEDAFEEMLSDEADVDDMDFPFEESESPLHLVKSKHTCKCGHHHDEDHECHCHEDGHVCHCHDDDCDCDDDWDDEDDEDMDLSGFDNLFLGVLCPECGHMFCVTDEDFDAPGVMYHCPFCSKDVHVAPIDPNNVPVAKRVK